MKTESFKNGDKLPAQTELWMNISGAQLASEADWDNKSGWESNVSLCQPPHNAFKRTTYSPLFIFSLFTTYGTKYVFIFQNKKHKKYDVVHYT